MASGSLFRVITIAYVTSLSLLVHATPTPLRPHIITKYHESIIEAGQNFDVECEGNLPITWTTPTIPNDTDTETRKHITNFQPKNGKFKYGSKLTIEEITYPWVGFYYCHNQDSDPFNDAESTNIYLFVKDEEHLSVSQTEVDTMITTQYKEVVIPCRPTSPDVTVELFLFSGDKKDDAIFNPKTGFSFRVNELSDEGLYFCMFSRGDREHEVSIYLKVIFKTENLPPPQLKKENEAHGTVVGEKMVLKCSIETQAHITIDWVTPTGKPDENRMEISQLKRPGNDHVTFQELTIHKTTLRDKGMYYCNVSDNQEHTSFTKIYVTVFDVGEHFINLTEENDMYSVVTPAGTPLVKWRIDIKGHPEPKLYWLDNENNTILLERNSKYEIKFLPTQAILKIYNITIKDFGNYTLVAENQYESQKLALFLNVTDKPSVQIESDNFHMLNKPCTVRCIATAYPEPQINWFYKACLDDNCTFEPLNETSSEQNGLQLISNVTLTSSKSGYIKCHAENTIGEDEIIQNFYVSDVKDGLDIFGMDSTINYDEESKMMLIARDETLKMTCGASVYNYSEGINWLHDLKVLQNDDRYSLERSNTEYSNRLRLTVPYMDVVDGGVYSCEIPSKNGGNIYQNITVIVSDPTEPTINKTNLKKEVQTKLPKPLEFYCYVWGIPKPTVTWYKNDEIFTPTGRIHLENLNQRMVFQYTDAKDEGSYKCVASNKVGRTVRQVNLKIMNKPEEFNKNFIIVIVVLVVFLIFLGIFILIKMRNERKLQKELRIAGLANFEKGALENLNPDLGIDDQAELLPYDKRWEFPIEKLKLGKQLGSGAFGVVMKGEAKGINDEESSTTVAVKMVKRNADHTYIKALASELKIMVHLGKHINVVNLLGACTKNVAKRELLVIVEYCRYGNLHNYLLRHRENFIDQVDPKTGSIDYTIGLDILERTYSNSSDRSNSQSPYLKYAALTFSNSNGEGSNVPSNMEDYRGKNYSGGITAKTDITLVSMTPTTDDETGTVVSNNSIQPEWRSNYKCDYKGNVKPICTKDLLAWTFQVSRGMEYLASRKVLHGDLAARNILLADNNVVKICDFGLAKSMYKNDNYKKKGDGPLPVKWMAIESIRDRVFSTQSDVWSFGIVLWEFFSLARTPYPGMEADERLYNKLVDGYRMESPDYSPKEIYKMMLDCWQPRPTLRPSFTKLAERIGSLLEDSVRKHYIDLNDPYLVMNTNRLEDGQSDYLMMLSPPNFEQLSSPHQYANSPSPQPEGEATPGYLCMKPANIFSPRVEDERVFDFTASKTRDKSDQNDGTELMPMLGIPESDCESTCNTPCSPDSFANPSYHVPPKVENVNEKNNKDIVKFCADNYVNMPQNKSAIKNNEKNNNPFIKVEGDKKHYVNGDVRDWESVQV